MYVYDNIDINIDDFDFDDFCEFLKKNTGINDIEDPEKWSDYIYRKTLTEYDERFLYNKFTNKVFGILIDTNILDGMGTICDFGGRHLYDMLSIRFIKI